MKDLEDQKDELWVSSILKMRYNYTIKTMPYKIDVKYCYIMVSIHHW